LLGTQARDVINGVMRHGHGGRRMIEENRVSRRRGFATAEAGPVRVRPLKFARQVYTGVCRPAWLGWRAAIRCATASAPCSRSFAYDETDKGRRGVIAAACRGWRPYALLMLLCLGLYGPGLSTLPVTDRDEARFAQATRQMLETGDFVNIRFQDEARNRKPAGIYWLQAAAVAGLSSADSRAIWPYRVPSLLGATAAVLLTFLFGARHVGRETAFLGAGVLAASLGLVAEAHLAKTDAVLLACAVAAQGALGEIYRGERARLWPLIFWSAQAAAILVKGPVVPVLSLLTLLALTLADRDWRWLGGLRPLWGVPLLGLLVAPWVVAISRATGGAFLGEAVGHDFLGKLVGAQESHGAPPGYYLALLPLTFWPGSLLLGGALAWAWRARRTPEARFLLAWALPFWLVLELVPTKLPHYLLPAFPALALMAGRALGDGVAAAPRWIVRTVAAIWTLASLLIAATLVLAPMQLSAGIDASGVAVTVVIVVFGAGMLRLAWQALEPTLAVRAALLALFTLPAAFALEAPRLGTLWLSRAAAAMVEQERPPPGVPVSAVGYAEPSLVFLLGTHTAFASPDQAARNLTAARGALALVERREDAAFRAALGARGWQAQALARVGGLDYSNGKRMVLTLYRGTPG
jgi:4-amino-4-deoxy-L-arabinose transferase-like glycosyltransferase